MAQPHKDLTLAPPTMRPQRPASPTWRGISADRIVHSSAYDEATFAHEVERIFRRVWVFVCHESEIGEPGQYMRRTLPGGDPIVVLKDKQGVLRAFHNVCPHRGTMVVVEEEGCSASLLCPYHNWAFGLDGSLQGIPMESAYEGTGFQRENFGLTPLAVESCFGLVFVRVADEGPSLEEYLGPEVLGWLEKPFNVVPLTVFKRSSRVLESNWKGFAENSRDGYHVPFVHKFLRKGSPPQPYHLFPSGHQVQQISQDPKAVDEETWRASTAAPFPGFERGDGYLAVIFPDLVVTPRTNVIEIFSQTPVSDRSTIMEIRILGERDDSEEQRRARQLGYEVWLSKQPDEDAAVMEAQAVGLRSSGSRVSLIARGSEGVTGTRGDDKRLRQFWGTWRSYMGLDLNAGVNDQGWLAEAAVGSLPSDG
jgi:methanesulfonate monooxygenase large subunit